MDTQSLLESFSYAIIFISIFIESGVILGLFLPLPSFSLLFTAGVFAVHGQMDLLTIIIVGSIAAIAGYVAGYYTGSMYGRRLFYQKATTKYFTREQGLGIERYMKKYGHLTLIFGRFLPGVHNAAPLLSGVSKSPLLPFMISNVVGGLLWVITSVLFGYYAGQAIPHAQYYVIGLVVVTVIIANSPYGKRLLNRVVNKIEQM